MAGDAAYSRVTELRKCDALGASPLPSSAGERLVAKHKHSGLNLESAVRLLRPVDVRFGVVECS